MDDVGSISDFESALTGAEFEVIERTTVQDLSTIY